MLAIPSKNVSVTLVLNLSDVTFFQHVITHMTEHLKLLNFCQSSAFAALLNGLDDSCFEHRFVLIAHIVEHIGCVASGSVAVCKVSQGN